MDGVLKLLFRKHMNQKAAKKAVKMRKKIGTIGPQTTTMVVTHVVMTQKVLIHNASTATTVASVFCSAKSTPQMKNISTTAQTAKPIATIRIKTHTSIKLKRFNLR